MVFKCEMSPFKARSTFRRRSSALRDMSSSFSMARKTKKDSNIKVAVRLRPQNENERNSSTRNAVRVMDHRVLVFDPVESASPSRLRGMMCRDPTKKRNRDLKFAFDFVFDSDATNTDVYNNTTKPVLDKLLDGINCSVFAYGATGAGKTHTMVGKPDTPGVIVQTLVELYQRMEEMQEDVICDVQISYLEIYNENVRDLFCPDSGDLHVREDSSGVSVPQLSSHRPGSSEKLLEMLAEGNMNRTQHPTDANKESSRSHGVFQLTLEQRPRTSGVAAEVLISKMSLIDLAGSERATATRNCGDRFREGANINKSLLALGNCINALAKGKKGSHIPYRNSKLTRILKDSLGGKCHTVMIAAISPSQLSYDDTYNTLKYADRAKQIKADLKKNVFNVDYHVHEYAKIVKDLQAQNLELKLKLNETREEKNQLAAKMRHSEIASVPHTSSSDRLLEELLSAISQCGGDDLRNPIIARVKSIAEKFEPSDSHRIRKPSRTEPVELSQSRNAAPPIVETESHSDEETATLIPPKLQDSICLASSRLVQSVAAKELRQIASALDSEPLRLSSPARPVSPILLNPSSPAPAFRPCKPTMPYARSPAQIVIAGRVSPIEEEALPEIEKQLSFSSPANISSVLPPWEAKVWPLKNLSPRNDQPTTPLNAKPEKKSPVSKVPSPINVAASKPTTTRLPRTPLSARQLHNVPVIPSPSPIQPSSGGANRTFRKMEEKKLFAASSPVILPPEDEPDDGNSTFTIEVEKTSPKAATAPSPSTIPAVPLSKKVSPDPPKGNTGFKKPLLPPKARAPGAASKMGIPSMSQLLGGHSTSSLRTKLMKSPSSSRLGAENQESKAKLKKSSSSSMLPQQRWVL